VTVWHFPLYTTPMFNKESLYQIYSEFQVVSFCLWRIFPKYNDRIQNCGIQQSPEHFDIPFSHFLSF
jgi:hypothetical protein